MLTMACFNLRCIKIISLEHRYKVIQNENKKPKDNKRKLDDDRKEPEAEDPKEPKESKKVPKRKARAKKTDKK